MRGGQPSTSPRSLSRACAHARALFAHRSRLGLLAITLANVAVVWAVSVLPGQDLPQHLTYVRILVGYGDASLPFAATYTLPTHVQSYFTTYYLLAAIARLTGVVTAARVVLSLYVVAMVAAFDALTRALSSRARTHAGVGEAGSPSVTSLLAPLVIWNPVVWMGFLPFYIGMPAILWGYAAFLEGAHRDDDERPRPGRLAQVAVAGALLASLHTVAAAAFVLLVAVHAALARGRRTLLFAAVALLAVALTSGLFRIVGDPALGDAAPALSRFGEVVGNGIDEVTGILHIDWGTPLRKLDYAYLAFVGALTLPRKMAVMAGALTVVGVAVASRAREANEPAARPTPAVRTATARTLTAYWALCLVIPSAIQVPSDISFLDYRIIAVTAAISLAFVDERLFASRAARGALALFAALVTGLWVRTITAVGNEARAVEALVGRLDSRAVLLALPIDDTSREIDEGNTVGHYWPMLHTIQNGGLTSQFWGKFTHHLPIGYRDGRALPAPDDRHPWEATRAQIHAFTHVVVSYPDENADAAQRTGASAIRAVLATDATVVACDGRSCLYAVLPASGK